MAAKGPRSAKVNSARADGRKSLLVYLNPAVIKELKKAALDEDKSAYEIAEEAVSVWLANRKTGGKTKAE